MFKSNLALRTISGIVFVALIAGSILVHPYLFALFFSVVSACTAFEFQRLMNTHQKSQLHPLVSAAGALFLFISTFLYSSGFSGSVIFGIYILYVIVVFVAELYRKQPDPLNNWAYFCYSQVYTALPFALLNGIIYIGDFYHPMLLLALFVTIWVNDTGAYVFGVSFGKHRLFERVSPKKSWEGFVGGAGFALISGYVFSLFIPGISLINWLVFSEIIVAFGTLGDLTESLLKRSLGIKDAGNIIPGHGGMLDRFDSMLLAAPVIFLFLKLIYR